MLLNNVLKNITFGRHRPRKNVFLVRIFVKKEGSGHFLFFKMRSAFEFFKEFWSYSSVGIFAHRWISIHKIFEIWLSPFALEKFVDVMVYIDAEIFSFIF